MLRLVPAVLAALLLVLPASASADVRATVVDGVLWVDGTDAADWATIADLPADGEVEVLDPDGTETAGPGCTQDALVVECAGVTRVVVRLGAGDDTLGEDSFDDVTTLDTDLPVTADGADGADVLVGGYGPDVLTGGPGLDALYGEGGADRLGARDGATDELDCGAGTDTLFADLRERSVDCETTAPLAGAIRLVSSGIVGSRISYEVDGVDASLPRTITYDWLRCAPAGDACMTALSTTDLMAGYTLSAADLGSSIRLRQTVTNGAGTAESVSAPIGPVVAAPPRVVPPRAPRPPRTPPVKSYAAKFSRVAKPAVRRGRDGKVTVDTGYASKCRVLMQLDCLVTLTARGGKDGRGKPVVYGRGTWMYHGAAPKRLTVTLTRAGARRLRATGRLRLVVSLRAEQWAATDATKQVTLTVRR